MYVYRGYFGEKSEDKAKSVSPYPGPINNFSLISFKDYWKDNINEEENIFLRDGLELNKDYTFINHNECKMLKIGKIECWVYGNSALLK